MAVQGVLQALTEPLNQISIATVLLILLLVTYFTLSFTELETVGKLFNAAATSAKFAYSCFLKPHTGDNTGNQQDALESFYKTQASIYDVTRSRLLRGREDMLAMAAAQLRHQLEQGQYTRKPIWVVSYTSCLTMSGFGHCANSVLLEGRWWRHWLEH